MTVGRWPADGTASRPDRGVRPDRAPYLLPVSTVFLRREYLLWTAPLTWAVRLGSSVPSRRDSAPVTYDRKVLRGRVPAVRATARPGMSAPPAAAVWGSKGSCARAAR